MIIYDDEKKILYVPSAGDRIIYDDYEEKVREAYQSGYTAGFEQGVSDAEEACGSGYRKKPLTFEVLSAGTVMFIGNNETLTGLTIEYSINDGSWTELVSSFEGATISVNPGDVVRFRGNNETYGLNNIHNKLICTGEHNIYGNIMSLLNATDFEDLDTVGFHTFDSFFRGQEGEGPANRVVDASNLVLPAAALGDSSYSEMFMGCDELLAAPELPATSLARACYYGMFHGCTKLQTAPALPAETLVNDCYINMFNGCASLNYIKCLAKNYNGIRYTFFWTTNVSGSGTFVKAPDMHNWGTGENGIPNGWTVVDAE